MLEVSYPIAAAAESLRTWGNCSEPEHKLLHSWDNLAWNSPSWFRMVTSQQKMDLLSLSKLWIPYSCKPEHYNLRDLEIYNTRHVAKGPSIIDVDYEGEGGSPYLGFEWEKDSESGSGIFTKAYCQNIMSLYCC